MSMASTPKRIQRKRTPGWRMPGGARYVGRPTKFGNPWTPEMYWAAGYCGPIELANRACVEAYRAWLSGREPPLFPTAGFQMLHLPHWSPGAPPDVTELRGVDLACWCPLVDANGNPVPCHADILLEVANT